MYIARWTVYVPSALPDTNVLRGNGGFVDGKTYTDAYTCVCTCVCTCTYTYTYTYTYTKLNYTIVDYTVIFY